MDSVHSDNQSSPHSYEDHNGYQSTTSSTVIDHSEPHPSSRPVSNAVSDAHPLVSDDEDDDDNDDNEDDENDSQNPDTNNQNYNTNNTLEQALFASIHNSPQPPPPITAHENDSDSDEVPQSLIVDLETKQQQFSSPPQQQQPSSLPASPDQNRLIQRGPSILNTHRTPDSKLNVRIQESSAFPSINTTASPPKRQPPIFVTQRTRYTTVPTTPPHPQSLPLPVSTPHATRPSISHRLTYNNNSNNYISENVGAVYNTLRNTTAGYLAGRPRINLSVIDPKERALWKWTNVEHLDNFLREIYDYYLGNGFYCILLSRALNMATLLFMITFSTYLSTCIDYSKIRSSTKLSEVQYPQCASRLSGFSTFLLWLFALFWFIKLTQYIHDIKRLLDLKHFYFYLLEISEAEMQTISWQQVVKRLMLLRDKNPTTSSKTNSKSANTFLGSQSKKRLTPHDVANRIMRKENYMIAMINKNTLNITLPLPFYHEPFLTRTLEWNLSLCIMDFVFQNGEIRPVFLKEQHRDKLVSELKHRFILAGFTNIACAPITILYMALLYFFRYFNEYHKDPSAIGTRQYTPLAEWKMREFNELHHMFQKRLHMSYAAASRYVNQFPKEKTVLLSRFVIFMAGSFAAVLGIITLIDPEIFLGFEITKDRNVLFYLGLFGSIVAVARGMIPEETYVFDPETSIYQVAKDTHYLPDEWEGRYHTDEVKDEFAKMYDLRIMIIFRELLSVILMPFILWFSLPKSSEDIIDFFRECSTHIDGLGYVCNFAKFDFSMEKLAKFQKGSNHRYSYNTEDPDTDEVDLRQDYFSTTDGKMLKSYLNFLDNYGDDQQSRMSASHLANSRSQWANQAMPPRSGYHNFMMGPGGTNNGVDSFFSTGDLENSVMARYTRIQQNSGNNTPLTRSGVFDNTGLPLGMPNALSSAFERNSRRAQSPSVHGGNSLRRKTAAPAAATSRMRSFSADPARMGTSLRYEITPEEESQKFNRHKHGLRFKVKRDEEDDDEEENLRQKSGDDTDEDEDNDDEYDEYMNDGEEDSYVLNTFKKNRETSTSAEDEVNHRKLNSGVLGLLDQFYKHNDVTKL